ncbi:MULTISPECIES: hypothetical protein [unclassified Fibrobacter]|uniref:hypothetical protein n=1 Tax=unclassified Fibrobacter TaxID=2634177 RepID=UPI000D7A564C|nr:MULTISPECIES: hypothetical protein [unclassified Fibrobacter]PWJ60755.1 hypothetical protein BGX12_13625 [Fibrobacter sp. UWR4]PZW64371.1 hypothetical protein C8E88_103825 [Fibrobacter sp. UWR1]
MKKYIISACAALAMTVFSACSIENPTVVAGREWNPANQSVADTTSVFKMNEQMVVQFRYGKNFDFGKLKTTFFEGTAENKGREIWSHEVPVSPKVAVYTLQGKSKMGGLMNAKEMTRLKKPGTVLVEFSADGQVLASKNISVELP